MDVKLGVESMPRFASLVLASCRFDTWMFLKMGPLVSFPRQAYTPNHSPSWSFSDDPGGAIASCKGYVAKHLATYHIFCFAQMSRYPGSWLLGGRRATCRFGLREDLSEACLVSHAGPRSRPDTRVPESEDLRFP